MVTLPEQQMMQFNFNYRIPLISLTQAEGDIDREWRIWHRWWSTHSVRGCVSAMHSTQSSRAVFLLQRSTGGTGLTALGS